MRLVSTVELITLRERVHNVLSSFDEPVKDSDFDELKKADASFRTWFATWDHAFSQKYEDAGRIAVLMWRLFDTQSPCSILPTKSSNTAISCRTIP